MLLTLNLHHLSNREAGPEILKGVPEEFNKKGVPCNYLLVWSNLQNCPTYEFPTSGPHHSHERTCIHGHHWLTVVETLDRYKAPFLVVHFDFHGKCDILWKSSSFSSDHNSFIWTIFKYLFSRNKEVICNDVKGELILYNWYSCLHQSNSITIQLVWLRVVKRNPCFEEGRDEKQQIQNFS